MRQPEKNGKYQKGIIYVSDHAVARAKERLGWDKETLFRMMPRVIEKGHRNPYGKEDAKPNNIYECQNIIYGENLYVIKHQTLVTVVNVRNKYRMKNSMSQKKRRSKR